MKNTKTKIVLSAIIFLLIASFIGTANAASTSLYLSPSTLTKATGNTFSISVGVNVLGNKVCAVEGTLSFNNLSCQSITMADGVMTQSSPTCSNPYFLIGIPNCTIIDKALLTVSVKAGSAGIASMSVTGVDVMGEGTSISTTSVSGNYTLTPPPPVFTPKPDVVQPKEESSVVKNQPEEITIPQQEQQKEETAPTPVSANTFEANVAQASLSTVMVNILSFGTGKTWLLIISIVILLIVLVFVVAYFVRKIYRRKKI